MGAESFHEDRKTDAQTDMTKLIADFRDFANAPQNKYNHCVLKPHFQPNHVRHVSVVMPPSGNS
jgi:hypothetical protein